MTKQQLLIQLEGANAKIEIKEAIIETLRKTISYQTKIINTQSRLLTMHGVPLIKDESPTIN